MKRVLLYCLLGIALQGNLFSMEPQGLRYTFANGSSIHLTDNVLNLSQLLLDNKDKGEQVLRSLLEDAFAQFNFSEQEIFIFCDLLNSIVRDAHEAINNYYVSGDVFVIIGSKCQRHNIDIQFMTRIINLCDFLDCPIVLNGCIRAFMELYIPRIKMVELIDHYLIHFYRNPLYGDEYPIIKRFINTCPEFNFFNEKIISYFCKHFKRLKFAELYQTYIQEYNVLDYITMHGVPNITSIRLDHEDGESQCIQGYDFSAKGLTSLEGLHALSMMDTVDADEIMAFSFSGNYLELVEPDRKGEFMYFPSIEGLDFSNNYFTYWPSYLLVGLQFAGQPSIVSLNLSGNSLTALSPDIFANFTVNNLLLSHNNLATLSSLPQGLMYLDLHNCKITDLPDDILSNCPDLIKILLHGNPISDKRLTELKEKFPHIEFDTSELEGTVSGSCEG